ncbi:MAG: hypothetical protein J5915_03925 [Acidaminococcaceae bacterium]|nr:hypothetical protein [Acidaminococcaceae bacterium]MBQ5343864.1 hypothetical protein [Acidaminococcaceae bacterium]
MDIETKYKLLKKFENKRFTAKEFPITDIESKYLHQITGSGDALAVFNQDDLFEISDVGKDFIQEYERNHRSIVSNEFIAVISFLALIVAVLEYLK